MMTYAIILIIILGLVASIVRWYNLPAVVEQRRLAKEARFKAQDERRSDQAEKAATRRAEKAAKEARRQAQRDARRKRP